MQLCSYPESAQMQEGIGTLLEKASKSDQKCSQNQINKIHKIKSNKKGSQNQLKKILKIRSKVFSKSNKKDSQNQKYKNWWWTKNTEQNTGCHCKAGKIKPNIASWIHLLRQLRILPDLSRYISEDITHQLIFRKFIYIQNILDIGQKGFFVVENKIIFSCQMVKSRMIFGFVLSEGMPGSARLIAEVAGDDDSFQVVCFNVIFYVAAHPFLSTHVAPIS